MGGKKGFTLRFEQPKWGRVDYHRPTRSIRSRREELRESALEEEALWAEDPDSLPAEPEPFEED